jgi:cytidylate kinase
MAVITISRNFGAGGITLGERLANDLGYNFVNDQLIKEVADNVGVSIEQIQQFEKRGTSKLDKFLNFIVSPSFLERHSDKHGYVHEKMYTDEIAATIIKLYEKGNAVIIGRGGNYTLQGYPGAIHILLVADMEHRVRFLTSKYKMTEGQAEKAIKRADMIRNRFLECFSPQENHDDPRLYTMVLNMNQVTMDKAIELVKALLPQ